MAERAKLVDNAASWLGTAEWNFRVKPRHLVEAGTLLTSLAVPALILLGDARDGGCFSKALGVGERTKRQKRSSS